MSPRTVYTLLALGLLALGMAELALGWKISAIFQFTMAGLALIASIIVRY